MADKLEEVGVERVSIKGAEVNCRCPFHDDGSPSFFVNPSKGKAHCFGCGVKFGSIGGFLEVLSKKTGKTINHNYQHTPESLFSFIDYKREEEGQLPSLNPSIIRTYKQDPDYFIQNWGVSKEVVEKRQLVLDPQTGAECFPIFNLQEELLGFVERWPPTGDKRSIYKYPRSFKKSKLLIGNMPHMKEVWVTEGMRDLCRVETLLGVDAVALGGSEPSDYQIELLKRFDKVVLCLDNDEAGKKGRDKLIEVIRPKVLYIATYEGGDPCSGKGFKAHSYADYLWLFS